MKRLKGWLIALALGCAALSSCNNHKTEDPRPDHYDRVVILFGEGYNNLSRDIKGNIDSLSHDNLPARGSSSAMLVFSNLAKTKYDWESPTTPVLFHMYKDRSGNVRRDTLMTYPDRSISVDPAFMREVLRLVEKEFPSDSYGMIYSSHATGWIPKGYSSKEEGGATLLSLGAMYDGRDAEYNLNIDEFRDALPFRFDFIIFDACLMGGIETTYALRNSCDYIVASPAEIWTRGFCYQKMASRLFAPDAPDLVGLSEDFYKNNESEGATVAVYDTRKVQAVADAVKPVFAAYRDKVWSLDKNKIQDYNYSFYYHFDMRDLCANLVEDEAELAELDEALSQMIVFKKATSYFGSTQIDLDRFSGVSMFLPSTRWPKLTGYYKDTEWNSETLLIEKN